MTSKNISILKIHKLTQEQYNRELEAGRIDENALYLTPDDDDEEYYTKSEIDSKIEELNVAISDINTAIGDIDAALDAIIELQNELMED